ncbi:cysteine hydrolase family protein [Paenibacillus sedimenti]|uniref:Cysteine hydrolase n=1 Tax=Paenibacillus sedimenti TaxID=2770274 RepID=A0A926KUP9_9BACL|nr:cysteine hydrolase family protein [Paenibacillus sedimenti]MBD0382484.1 cysteine hydrolase [Paenibacillus sedimenti]
MMGLIVIDVQKAFDDPTWGPRNNPQAEEQIAFLLEAWRNRKLPIFHIRHVSQSRFAKGTIGFEFKAQAMPLAGETVLEKTVNSAFIGTDLEQRLRAMACDTVVIVGLTTNHCVETTTRMAGNLGFKTYLVSDATATFDRMGPDGFVHKAEDVHRMTLANLHEEFATIVTTSELMELFSWRIIDSSP